MADIYLIDDDSLVNYLNREMIQSMAPNSRIESFELAARAIDSLRSKMELQEPSFPHWIFLDINMPFMDGWDFLEQYALLPLEYRQQTKICLLSSSIDKNDLDRSAANPYVFEYLMKPLSEEQLEGIGLAD